MSRLKKQGSAYYYGEGFFNPSPINRDFKIHIRRKSAFSESLGVAEGGIVHSLYTSKNSRFFEEIATPRHTRGTNCTLLVALGWYSKHALSIRFLPF